MIEIREFVTEDGRAPFSRWFQSLNAQAAVKVTIALSRLEQDNFSNVKSVGIGVFEIKISFGPGYRVYFGKDGDRVVILLGGGTKRRQSSDIAIARKLWIVYKKERNRNR